MGMGSNETKYRFLLRGKHRSLQLNGEVIVVGRSHSIPCFRYPEDMEEVFPLLSRLHAVLYPWGHTYAVYDLKSQGGVFINGKRIEGEYRLKVDDQIELGGLKLCFCEDNGSLDKTEELAPYYPEENVPPPRMLSPKEQKELISEALTALENEKDGLKMSSIAADIGQKLTGAERASVLIEDGGFYKKKTEALRSRDGGEKIIPPTEASLVYSSIWEHLSARSIVLFGRTAYGLVNPGPFNILSVTSVLALPFVIEGHLAGSLVLENYKGSHHFSAKMAFAALVVADQTAKAMARTDYWRRKDKSPKWDPPDRDAPYEVTSVKGPVCSQILDNRPQLICGTPSRLLAQHVFECQPARALLIPPKDELKTLRVFPLRGHEVSVNGENIDFQSAVADGDLVTVDGAKFFFSKAYAYSDEITNNRKRTPGDVDFQRFLQIKWHNKVQLPIELLPDENLVFWPDRLKYELRD